MAEIVKMSAQIVKTDPLADGIFSLWLTAPEIAQHAVPGQFAAVYCRDASRLLPRPISLCEIDKALGRIRLVYRIAGAGTKELAGYKAGEWIEVMGPLGNGYNVDGLGGSTDGVPVAHGKAGSDEYEDPHGEAGEISEDDYESLHRRVEGASADKHVILMGGGIGIPPLLALAKSLACEKTAVLGYRDSQTFLKEEFEACGCRVIIATDDGSVGRKGNVVDAAKAENVRGDMIFSCGPTPMQRGVKALAGELGIPAQLSLEERMACGIGACLACVCRSKEVDGHSHVNNKRVCKDGPVFRAEEIEL